MFTATRREARHERAPRIGGGESSARRDRRLSGWDGPEVDGWHDLYEARADLKSASQLLRTLPHQNATAAAGDGLALLVEGLIEVDDPDLLALSAAVVLISEMTRAVVASLDGEPGGTVTIPHYGKIS